jgi:SPP1 family predicted phage head-tail adaptor
MSNFEALCEQMDDDLFEQFGETAIYNGQRAVSAIFEKKTEEFEGQKITVHEFTVRNRQVGALAVGDTLEKGWNRYTVNQILSDDGFVIVASTALISTGNGGGGEEPGEVGIDQAVELWQQTRTPDGHGGFTVTWAKVTDIMAGIKQLPGDEKSQAGRLARVARVEFTVQTASAYPITEKMQFRWKGRQYNIRYVPETVTVGERIKIIAEAGVAQ